MKRYLMTFLVAFMVFHCMGASPSQADSHDITSLHAWGPYSKRYAGISHIPDMSKGIRFDFSVMPGYYRNRQLVPHVLFESSYYPWEINPEVNRITTGMNWNGKTRFIRMSLITCWMITARWSEYIASIIRGCLRIWS